MCRCLTLNKWSKTRSSSTNNYFVVTLNIKPSRYDDQLRPEGLHRVGGPQEGGGHRRALLRDRRGRGRVVRHQTEGILEGALEPDDHRLPGCGMASGDRPSR